MNWASERTAECPKFKQLAITRKSVESDACFRQLLKLFDIFIEYEEPEYYVVNGSDANLSDFREYWSLSDV